MLEPGEQELQIISALGPLQLYLANRHQFQELSRLVDNAALTADYVNPATLEEGALVLAESTGVWHRARITKILPNNFFRVDLFDFDREAEVELNEIGRVAEDLMKIPVLMMEGSLGLPDQPRRNSLPERGLWLKMKTKDPIVQLKDLKKEHQVRCLIWLFRQTI